MFITSKGTKTRKPHAALRPIPIQIPNIVSISLSFVGAHQLALGENMFFHGLFQLLFCDTGFQVQHQIQGIKFEEVTMRLAWRRTGSAVAKMLKIIHPLRATA